MRERLTARALLADPRGRQFLVKGRLPSAPDAQDAWFAVGGGVEPGETTLQAAAREIREETGLKDFELGRSSGGARGFWRWQAESRFSSRIRSWWQDAQLTSRGAMGGMRWSGR